MTYRPGALLLFVFGNVMFLAMRGMAVAQTRDSLSAARHVDSSRFADTTRPVTFTPRQVRFSSPHQRRIDLALTGGIGYYSQVPTTALQPTANADFFAQTSNLDLTAGFHWGFSNPSTGAVDLGLRFPITASQLADYGVFADAALLFIDDGRDSDFFSTGLRMDLAARSNPVELRFVAELRRIPIDDRFEAWGGIELGFFFNILHEPAMPLTRKDSLREELRYIATTSELDNLVTISSNEELDEWLNRFWRAHNVTGSPMNEVRQEYMRRVELANQRYSTPNHLGVATDMGRVLLLYGEPDRVQDVGSLYDSERRYELWIDESRVKGYHIAYFLFVNSETEGARGTYTGHGEFREVYSNVAGEPSDGLPSDLPQSMENILSF